MASVVEVGDVAWSTEEILESYPEFKAVYNTRPIKNNRGGMKAAHAFATWFMLKKLSPSLVIESGVLKGQSTWLIETVCPKAELICLDVDLSNIQYRSSKAKYIETDFTYVDFSTYDKQNALCFFDDHQNALTRLQQMQWKGFDRAIFEDNYHKLRGDFYSLNKIFDGNGFSNEKPAILDSKKLKWSVLRNKIRANIFKLITGSNIWELNSSKILPNDTHRKEVLNKLQLYYEFPPLFKEYNTMFGDVWDDEKFPTKEPLFGCDVEDDLREEAIQYTWICLVELKKQ